MTASQWSAQATLKHTIAISRLWCTAICIPAASRRVHVSAVWLKATCSIEMVLFGETTLLQVEQVACQTETAILPVQTTTLDGFEELFPPLLSFCFFVRATSTRNPLDKAHASSANRQGMTYVSMEASTSTSRDPSSRCPTVHIVLSGG